MGLCPAAGVATEATVTAGTEQDDWLEQPVAAGFRVWQILFLCLAGLLTLVVLLCCCVRVRIPRTKQEIEADFARQRIARHFRRQLRAIDDADMDAMDLRTALERVRAELRDSVEGEAPPPGSLSAALSATSLASAASCNAAPAAGPDGALRSRARLSFLLARLRPPQSVATTCH